jgi:hypothetical protein
LREKPSVIQEGATDSYRLIVRCRPDTREGEIKIAWANPPAREGQMMAVTIDRTQAFQHKVEGGRAQGNGNNGPGATVLKVPLPLQSLTISNLFAEDNVVFPFGELSPAARRDISTCFPEQATAQ